MNRYSIIQDRKQCYVCGTTKNINIHEIYFGKNRQNSIKNGFCAYLCGIHHNLSNAGVHFNKELDLKLKQECQRKFEETHTREEFMNIIKRSYL